MLTLPWHLIQPLIFVEVSVCTAPIFLRTFVFEARCGSLSTRDKIYGDMEDI